MINQDLAKLMQEMSDRMAMKNESRFRVRAYSNAAKVIESLSQDMEEVYKTGGLKALEDLPGIGESIASKTEEYIKTGKIKDLEKLRKQVPIDLESLVQVEGLGPMTAQKLYKSLKVKNLEDLQKAAESGKIRKLSSMGEKSEQRILRGLGFLRGSKGRFLLGDALPLAEKIITELKAKAPVKQIELAGSIRRRKETIGDIDILVTTSDPKKVIQVYSSLPEVASVTRTGPTGCSVKFKQGLNGDLRVLKDNEYGAGLQYFTGGKEHNVAVRKIAIDKGYKLNEYGLFTIKGNKRVAGRTEEEIYTKLGMKIMPPEIREDKGEVEASLAGKLPKLIEYNDLQGDLQVQTNATDGTASILEMAAGAKKIGLKYIAITDHTKNLTVANGQDEAKILQQMKEIDAINKKIKGIRILKGAEVNILPSGTLDIKDEVLKKLDVVGVSIHSHFNIGMDEKEMTQRVIKAISNPNVDILFHPTARKLLSREPIAINIKEVIKVAKKNNVALEIDSYIDRLDLRDDNIRVAVEAGAKLVIDSDSHHVQDFDSLKLGIAQARRGWAKKSDVLNTLPLEKLLDWLRKK